MANFGGCRIAEALEGQELVKNPVRVCVPLLEFSRNEYGGDDLLQPPPCSAYRRNGASLPQATLACGSPSPFTLERTGKRDPEIGIEKKSFRRTLYKADLSPRTMVEPRIVQASLIRR